MNTDFARQQMIKQQVRARDVLDQKVSEYEQRSIAKIDSRLVTLINGTLPPRFSFEVNFDLFWTRFPE